MPSAAALAKPQRLAPAERVVTALSACLATPPRMIGTTKLRRSSMFVRRLAPQEDRLDLTRLATSDMEPSRATWSAAAGRSPPSRRHAPSEEAVVREDLVGLLDRAMALAGMHQEALYTPLLRRPVRPMTDDARRFFDAIEAGRYDRDYADAAPRGALLGA